MECNTGMSERWFESKSCSRLTAVLATASQSVFSSSSSSAPLPPPFPDLLISPPTHYSHSKSFIRTVNARAIVIYVH